MHPMKKKIKVHVSYLRMPKMNVCTGHPPNHLNRITDHFYQSERIITDMAPCVFQHDPAPSLRNPVSGYVTALNVHVSMTGDARIASRLLCHRKYLQMGCHSSQMACPYCSCPPTHPQPRHLLQIYNQTDGSYMGSPEMSPLYSIVNALTQTATTITLILAFLLSFGFAFPLFLPSSSAITNSLSLESNSSTLKHMCPPTSSIHFL